jgi:hypothetical protein
MVNYNPSGDGPEFSIDFEQLARNLEDFNNFDPELRENFLAELRALQENPENVVLLGTDGEFAVTIVHVDAAAIGGADGPVLFPTASKKTIFAAVSRELLQKKVFQLEELPEEDGNQLWEEFMEELVAQVTSMHKKNPKTF